MKKELFLSAALLLSMGLTVTACGGDDDDDGTLNYSTTVTAKKSEQIFEEISDNEDMKIAYWQSGESLLIISDDAAKTSSLKLGSYGNRSGDFSGKVRGNFTKSSTFSVYSPASEITVSDISPSYSYSGQTGKLNNIYKYNFAYGSTSVEVVNNSTAVAVMELKETNMKSLQTICKFTFKDSDGDKITVTSYKIKSTKGVVREISGDEVSDTGVLTITNGSSDVGNPSYVALRNSSSGNDTYTFDITSGSKSYTGTASITATADTYLEKEIEVTEE